MNTAPPKILIVTPRFAPLLGGQELQAFEMAEGFKGRGYFVEVLTELDFESSRYVKGTSHEIFRLKYKSNSRASRILLFIKYLKFFHNHAEGFCLVVARTFCVGSLALSFYSLLHRKKGKFLLLTDSLTEVQSLLDSKFKNLFKCFFSGFQYINAISIGVESQLNSLGIRNEKITRIPNILNHQMRNKVGNLIANPRNFLFVGNVVSEKGIFDLLEAFKFIDDEFTDAKLTIAGTGCEIEEVEKYVKLNDLGDKVNFTGQVPNSEMHLIYKNYDCLIFPSLTEGFGLVPYEAAASGMHVICSDVADLKLRLSGRATFFESGDVWGLTNCINKVCSISQDLPFDNSIWMNELSGVRVLDRVLDLFALPLSIEAKNNRC